MAEKIPIDLKEVQETLLLPLWGRAMESKKENPLFIDRKAVEIFESLDFDFSRIAENTKALSQLSWIGRAIISDQITRDYMRRNPGAMVVNFGCGMDTNYERLGDDSVTWWDIDLPEVIGLRRKFFPETENRKLLACSMLDFSWTEKIQQGGPVLFLAAGVLYYFEEKEVKDFFIRMAEEYHGTEFLFDAASPAGVRAANSLVIASTGMKENSSLKWGLKKLKDIESWDRDIKIIKKYSFFSDLRKQLPFRDRMGTYFADFLKIMFMIHLRIV